MCRSIRPLFNFTPPTTPEEIEAAARQFVRKVSGSQSPSRVNAAHFERAVEEISQSVRTLLGALVTRSPPRQRPTVAPPARSAGKRPRTRRGASGDRA